MGTYDWVDQDAPQENMEGEVDAVMEELSGNKTAEDKAFHKAAITDFLDSSNDIPEGVYSTRKMSMSVYHFLQKMGTWAFKRSGKLNYGNKDDQPVHFIVFPKNSDQTEYNYNVGDPANADDAARREAHNPYDAIFMAIEDEGSNTVIDGKKYQIVGILQMGKANKDIMGVRRHAKRQWEDDGTDRSQPMVLKDIHSNPITTHVRKIKRGLVFFGVDERNVADLVNEKVTDTEYGLGVFYIIKDEYTGKYKGIIKSKRNEA